MRRAAVLLLALTACANQKLETRMRALEASQAQTHQQLTAIDNKLETISIEIATVKAGDDAEETARKLDELAKELEALDVKVGSAPAAAPKKRAEPDGKDVYAVDITGAPSRGPADALVTMVRATDYACPYCEKSRATMDELMARYPKDLRIVYVPLIVHPAVATLPAEAACAAQKQGKFFEMDELIWTKSFVARDFSQNQLEILAASLALDMDQFRADMSGPCVSEVSDAMAAIMKFGAGATPTFYINGRYMAGAWPAENFAVVIDEELALAKKRVKAGTKKKKYYQAWVLGKGKKAFVP